MDGAIAQKCSEGNIGTSELFEEPDADNGAFKVRSWVFTGWDLAKPVFLPSMKYLVFAPEVCHDTGTHHWQGYVVWKSQRSMKATCKALSFEKHPYVYTAKAGIEKQLGNIGS